MWLVMSPGCFSRCSLHLPWKLSQTKSEKLNELSTVTATSVEGRVMETNSKAKLSENAREVVPTTSKYITATGKQALRLLQSAATVIPVPLIQEALKVALRIIEVCENISAIEKKVKELQDRVCHLMVAIVDNVTSKNEEGTDEVIVKAAKSIENDIKDLLSNLKTINEELEKFTSQGPWLLGIYSDLNANAVDACLDRLSIALEKFKLANDLRDSDLLKELHARLGKIHNLTRQVSDKVDDVHEDVKDIKQILVETQQSAPLHSSDAVFELMPLKPEVFYGRDDIIDEITQLLMKEETSRVCILGPGGMGKTSVSLGVVEQPLIKARFLPENIFWVPCIEATSATLLLEILSIQLLVPGSNLKQVTIEKIISLLDTSTQPRLILLDNFETPYNALDESQKQVADILRRLAILSHVAILVTMRGRNPPCNEAIKWQSKDIRPTDEAACLRIYHSIYPASESDHDVGTLLRVLGHMPFAVTLMARLANEGHSTAKELISAWSEYGPDIIPKHYEKSMNRSISLSVDSNLIKQNPQALLLLKVLSCLPAGTPKATLRWWVPALHSAMVPSAIAALSRTGLLVENERQDSDSPIQVLFVLPVVQSFMQQHDRIEEEIRHNIRSSCYQYVIDLSCRDDDPAFPIKSKALAAEDINIRAILFGTMQHNIELSDKAIEALIAFCWYRCDTKPNLEIVKHTVSMAKASKVKRYIASSLSCLGTTYFLLGEHYNAYDNLQEAYQLFNTLLPGDREIQVLCCRCGIDMVDVARFVLLEDGEKVISLAHDVEKQSTTSNDLVHGRSLIVLGWVLDRFGHRQEALRHLEQAKRKVMGNNHLLSNAFSAISHVQYRENRLPEALDTVKEAWEHSTNLWEQAQTSLSFGKILISLNRYAEAWKYIEISLMKSSRLGNRRDNGTALEYMGYWYLRRGDYLNAYGAYEAAVENYRGTIDEDPDGTRCKENMAKIKDKERNPELIVGFHIPRFDNGWRTLFYPTV